MSYQDIIHGDRRANRRYEFPLTMRFSCLDRNTGEEGTGCTVDLSRGGIRFRTDTPPPEGSSVELRIAWPFLLQNVCPLELFIWGKVLRNDGEGTVVRMMRYEFRTVGARSFQQPVEELSAHSFVA